MSRPRSTQPPFQRLDGAFAALPRRAAAGGDAARSALTSAVAAIYLRSAAEPGRVCEIEFRDTLPGLIVAWVVADRERRGLSAPAVRNNPWYTAPGCGEDRPPGADAGGRLPGRAAGEQQGRPDSLTARAARVYRDGLTQRQVAERLDVHVQTVRRHLARAGVAPRPRRVVLSEEDLDQAVRLWRSGASTRELGDRFGLAHTTIARLVKAHDVRQRTWPSAADGRITILGLAMTAQTFWQALLRHPRNRAQSFDLVRGS
ncbi:MAG: hypothetical protein LBO20_03970 [Bifidobacteriaceae bacterium]|nr:hypothetical protein [Bifidobacteriaceae bacterium]